MQTTALTDTVTILTAAIEAKDGYTSQHVHRVARFAEVIALELGLSANEVSEARLAGLLHDVGKVWVGDHVLHKNGTLDDEEWREMRRHPQFGWSTLVGAEGVDRVARAMLLHHERIDGRGYPFGLSGEEIPLLARIIAVADTFDAMTSDRPYRKALTEQAAYDEITSNGGTQFCEKVVDAFVRAFKLGRMGEIRQTVSE